MERIEHPDYLYISHLHGDHLDETWLPQHVSRDATVLLPGFPTRELERRMRGLGFTTIVRTTDGEELDPRRRPHRRDPRRGEHHRRAGRRLRARRQRRRGAPGQPERLPHERPRRAARSHGPVDLHWIQYSGAIWYPMVYDETARADARARRREGRQPADPGDAVRRVDRRARRSCRAPDRRRSSTPSCSVST